MHRQTLTLSTLLLVGLTAGCFGDRASGVVRQAQAGKTQTEAAQPAAAKPERTQPATTEPEAPPPDTEQPDTTQPAATSQPAAAQPAATQSSAPAADETKPGGTATAADDALADETLAVESANRQFYSSLNQVFAGKAAAMNDVWSHGDRVTCMGPGGGIATGWDEVQAMWEEQAKMTLGGHVDPDELHVTVGADLAIIQCYEVGSNRDPLGAELPVRIRATNSFRKQQGRWKMIGHHTDLLPYLAGPLGPLGKPSTSNLSDPGDPADTDSIRVKEDGVQLKLIE